MGHSTFMAEAEERKRAMSEAWRIEGLKIIGPTGEICTMTWAQGKGGIGAHEIVPMQRLIAQAPAMCEALKGFVRKEWFCHECSDTGATNGKPGSTHAKDCPACDGGRKFLVERERNRAARAILAAIEGK